MISYTGLDYIKIDIANQYGYDKESFEYRIAWVDANEHKLENLLYAADDSFRYAAAVMALRDHQAGQPTGHLVGLDVCASGIQIMSILTGCEDGAKNTGLIGKTREDIYENTTKIMNTLLEKPGAYSKKQVKPAVMTFYYGSKAKPKEIFGEDTEELTAFFQAQKIVAPGAYDLMQVLLGSWQAYSSQHCWTLPDGYEVNNKVLQMKDTKVEVDELDHTTFLYRHRVNSGAEEGLANAANVVHSIDGFINRELCRRCNYDKSELTYVLATINNELLRRRHAPQEGNTHIETIWEKQLFLSLVGTELINQQSVKDFGTYYLTDMAQLILETLKHPPFPVISVHDEFKCHANNMNRVRKTYIEICAELAESELLEAILTELTGTHLTVSKVSTTLGNKIRKGNYALS
jgi:hypothetical protein